MATYYGAADLNAMLAEFGVVLELQHGADLLTGKGIVDDADTELLTGEAASFASEVKVVLVKTGDWPGLEPGAVLVIEGKNHSVVQTRRADDGALTRVFVRPL